MEQITLSEMIYALLPSYTLILIEFQRDYYFDKHGTHGNNEIFMQLYDQLLDDDLLNIIHDYLFLEKKVNAKDATVAIALHKILVNDQILEIYDQNVIMKNLGDKG